MENLTTSVIARQNILNNNYALFELEKQLNIDALCFDGEIVFTKEMLANYFEIDVRTVERYVSDNKEELSNNGYQILTGVSLNRFKKENAHNFGTDINVGTKTTILAIFNFKSFLDMAMLISESAKAKELRAAMLDIVIDVINKKAGGNTKYINQRDSDFLVAWLSEDNYRKEFTDALNSYVDMGSIKYGMYTNRIYKDIFGEKAEEYRQILRLSKNDRIRDTMYSEVLNLISSYEIGLAYELQTAYEKKGAKLTPNETNNIFKSYHLHPRNIPLLKDARTKMASRDLAFRDALHEKLKDYLTPLSNDDYERFIGERSVSIEEQLKEAEDVFKRLKEY